MPKINLSNRLYSREAHSIFLFPTDLAPYPNGGYLRHIRIFCKKVFPDIKARCVNRGGRFQMILGWLKELGVSSVTPHTFSLATQTTQVFQDIFPTEQGMLPISTPDITLKSYLALFSTWRPCLCYVYPQLKSMDRFPDGVWCDKLLHRHHRDANRYIPLNEVRLFGWARVLFL